MQNSIIKYLLSFIRLQNIHSEGLDDYFENSKRGLLHILLLLAVFILIFFGISSYKAHVFDITIINTICTVLYIVLIISLRKNAHYNIIAFLFFFSLGSYFLYFMAYGGIAKSGFVWTFLYPLATIFFFGREKGLRFALIYLTIAAIFIFTFSVYNESSFSFQFRYISLYTAIVLIAYSFEKTRDKLTQTVAEKNLVLSEKLAQLKLKDRALTFSKEKAENADKLKSEFLAQMSHEIRTPINTILNYSSLIEQEFEGKLSVEIEDSFGSIKKASNRLIRTIDLILNLSAIEAGSYSPNYENIHLSSDIITPLVNEFEQTAKAKRLYLRIITNFDDEKPILADRYTLTQAIANLIDNAIKYTENGGLTLELKHIKNKYILTIVDTGVGISDEYLPKLFEKFTQETEGYTRRYEGSGLGLSLVKKYCEVNNASISVESKKGKGTIFSIEFPTNGK